MKKSKPGGEDNFSNTKKTLIFLCESSLCYIGYIIGYYSYINASNNLYIVLSYDI